MSNAGCKPICCAKRCLECPSAGRLHSKTRQGAIAVMASAAVLSVKRALQIHGQVCPSMRLYLYENLFAFLLQRSDDPLSLPR